MCHISKRVVDISGQRFNMFTVLSFAYCKNGYSYWNVKCDCGKEKTIIGSELRRKRGTVSCGCKLTENGFKRRKPKAIKPKREVKGRIIKCNFCSKEYFSYNCFIKERNYCSRSCHFKGMDKKITLICEQCKREYRVPVSFYASRGSKYCSIICTRIGRSIKQRGANSKLWKGGVSYEGKRIRKGVEWKLWREAVFKRDNYTCTDCGIRSAKGVSVELHPHHIKQFALYPDLRFDINNGTTLCKECHKKTDTYLKPIKHTK